MCIPREGFVPNAVYGSSFDCANGTRHCADRGCNWGLQTAEALQERSRRIYDKYGNVMMDVMVHFHLHMHPSDTEPFLITADSLLLTIATELNPRSSFSVVTFSIIQKVVPQLLQASE